jgi:DNA polymerase III epsilon subunit-like protein
MSAMNCVLYVYSIWNLLKSVINILDTFRIARELEVPASSLQDLLKVFQCPFDKLHCAGNDAHFTLRLLLLLAVKSCNKEDNLYHSSRLSILEEIAYAHIPQQMDPQEKAAKKEDEKKAKNTEAPI